MKLRKSGNAEVTQGVYGPGSDSGSTSLAHNHDHLCHSILTFKPVKMSMEESISLEETNRIRISLGLKPLTDDSKPADDKEQQAEDNYAKQREKEAKEREAKYVRLTLDSALN